MRTFPLALLAAAVVFATGNQVAAQDYPFVSKGTSWPGDCIFWSDQQCRATASGLLGYCRMNPWRRLNQVGPSASSLTSTKCMANRPGCWARLLRVAGQPRHLATTASQSHGWADQDGEMDEHILDLWRH